MIIQNLAGTILPLVLWIIAPRAVHCQVQTVDLNPYKSIPGIGDIFSGEDEKPFKDRWSFWLVIAIISAFLIVLGYFAFRGFRAYGRGKKDAAARAEAAAAAIANGDQNGAINNLENGTGNHLEVVDGIPVNIANVSSVSLNATLDAHPSVALSDPPKPEITLDAIELARRTGRRPHDAAIGRVIDLTPLGGSAGGGSQRVEVVPLGDDVEFTQQK